MSPWPCEDPERVDTLRTGAGLPPLAETTAELRRQAKREGDAPPKDYRARQAEIERWAREVGWLSPGDSPPRSWAVTAPGPGPWYALPVGLMVCWQVVTSIPPLGYYRELGVAPAASAPSQLSSYLGSLNVTTQNLLHFPAFFVMAWVWCWALRPGRRPQRAAGLALAIAGVFGLANELSQLAVPYRSVSLLDAISNLAGAALAALLYLKLALRSPTRSSR